MNRARFLFEITETILEHLEPGRVGIKIGPMNIPSLTPGYRPRGGTEVGTAKISRGDDGHFRDRDFGHHGNFRDSDERHHRHFFNDFDFVAFLSAPEVPWLYSGVTKT